VTRRTDNSLSQLLLLLLAELLRHFEDDSLTQLSSLMMMSRSLIDVYALCKGDKSRGGHKHEHTETHKRIR